MRIRFDRLREAGQGWLTRIQTRFRSGPSRQHRPSGETRRGRDAGMATAEYAIATLAACGFAGLLLTILRSGEVRGMLVKIIRSALSVG